MRTIFAGVLTISMVVGFAFIAYAIHETVPAETQVAEPGADAAQLNVYITKSKPYTSWQLWPGKGKFYPGKEPHGSLLTTYVNETAYSSVIGGKGMANGSIIVKENYTADRRLAALTVMYKIKGYNAPGGDWFWAKYGPDGKAMASGKVEACLKCHGEKKDNDFILTGVVKK
jgi:hypothetical protein